MRLRDGAAADGPAIALLHTRSWQQTYRGLLPADYLDGPVEKEREALWRERMANRPPGDLLLVAEKAEKLVGFLYALPDPDADPNVDGRILLDNIHVRADSRGQGIGERLFREAARRLLTAGQRTLVLYVIEGNVAAARFYARLGGERRATESHSIAGRGPFPLVPFVWTPSALAAVGRSA